MRAGRFAYALMYRLGFTPWDGHALPARLVELVEGNVALPHGKVLDIGCGTGDAAIYLARAGWHVTAIDFVERALARARAKTAAAVVEVRYLRADVTKLGASDVGGGFDLALDGGCLHGLEDGARDAYVREVSAAVAPGEIERRFTPAWELLATGVEPSVSRDDQSPIFFYDLRRRDP
jgi:SAM-dependent methyltransferase